MASTGADIQDGGGQTNSLSLEQREPLLRTKLFVPPIRSDRVPRPRLFERLSRGLDKALILISAPAGYGKTTLVSNWLGEIDVPATWLSLDDGDNDPIHFLQYFITALGKIVPAVQLDILGVLQDTQPASIKSLINALINAIADHAAPFVLVLDDFHTIHAQPVLEMVTHLLEHIPPQMHLLLLTRTDPPVPLAKLRARNQLTEIRVAQLRFTQTEIAFFLNEELGLRLSSNDITALEVRTEGWIAGLQLAAIALQATDSQAHMAAQGGQDVHAFVSAFTGSHKYIMDYLAEEVLRLQAEPIRSFLLQSSILDRMCGPLCDNVVETSQAGPVNGQATLEALEQANLFIVPLDGDRHWYRYHYLFAAVLNRCLEQLYPDRVPDLHRRASLWYEQNGFISEAIQHARMAGDQERAAQLVDQNGCLLLMRGEVVNLLKWIEAVEPRSQTKPWIAIQKAWALCLTGQLEQVEGPLQAAEGLISSRELTDDVCMMLGMITAARACRANMRGEPRLAADLARQALDRLPANNDFSCSLRSAATSILGDASWMDGELAEAGRAYAEAVLVSQAAGNLYMGIVANSNLADVLMEQGQLHKAARVYADALQAATLPDGQISPLAEAAYAGLSRVSYEWNQLEASEEYARRCIDLSRRWGSIAFQATGYVVLASLEHVRCVPEKARDAMRVAEQLLTEYQHTPWRSIWLASALARLWIYQGDLDRVYDLIGKNGIPINSLPVAGAISYQHEPLYLILLRLHLARGDDATVLGLSEVLLQKLTETSRVGRVIEVLVLRALAFQGRKDSDQALTVLGHAISLAQPEGYKRVFLDEDESMARLLYQARSHRVGAGYAAELLSAVSEPSGAILPPAQLLIEPLTSRELELLKLIEAGCSNQEIAERLIISIPTVKRHISNIYGKLGAGSRTQAVARGKELKLLG